MEAVFYIETVSIYHTTWSHIQSWPCCQYSPLWECKISCRVLTSWKFEAMNKYGVQVSWL